MIPTHIVDVYLSDRDRKWRWRAKARNGHIVADSGEGYSRRIDAVTAASNLLTGVVELRVPGRPPELLP